MSFPNRVIFQQNQSQLGRPPVNNDYISGMNFYGAYPSGFSDAQQTIPFLSLTQAENAGITDTHIGEVKATSTYVVSDVGTDGSTIVTITITNAQGVATQLCSVTQPTSATTITYATAIVAAINPNSVITGGYTASNAGGTSATVTISAFPGAGITLNTLSPVVTYTAKGSYEDSLAGIAFTGGAGSSVDVWHYHISEYFRLMPNGKLFVTVTPFFSTAKTYALNTLVVYNNSGTYQWYRCTIPVTSPGAWTSSTNWTLLDSFSDILTAQALAQGNIRQYGVYIDYHNFTTADVTAAKIIKNTLFSNNQPAEIWLGVNIASIADVGGSPGLTDLSGLNVEGSGCSGIGVIVGQDGAAAGAGLYTVYGKSVTTLGATFGATSNAPVNVDIGWVQQYNITDGTELNVPAFANGQLYSSVFNNENNALTQIDNYRYNFIMSYSGQVGTYFNDDKTATSSTDSFANMNDNRVIDKVHRVVYANLLPLVNGPIELNADGTIPPLTLAKLDSLARNPMEEMARNGEIAGDANGNLAASAVQIDPNQNVVENNGITIGVQPTENGTARQILVPIGYAN